MGVTYPSIITPGQTRFVWGQETGGYGVAPTVATSVYQETPQSIQTALQRNQYEATEEVGVPANPFDLIETTHHTQITINTAYRSNGIAAFALAALAGSTQGGATDVPAGTAPVTHTILPNTLSNNCNTFTIWHDSGDFKRAGARSWLQMTACTVEHVKLTFTPNTALMAEIVLSGNFPQYRNVSGSGSATVGYAPPGASTGTTAPTFKQLGATGGTAVEGTRMLGFQGKTFSFQSSKGVVYNNQILSGDITIQRTMEVIETPTQQNPIYFLPGPLQAVGTVNALFDGIGDVSVEGTIYQDYLDFAASGASGTTNEIKYTDTLGNGFDVQFYPIKWTSFTIDTSNQSLKVNGGFTSFNQLSTALTTGRITAVSQITLYNNYASSMIY